MLDTLANFLIYISSLGKGTPDELDIKENIVKLRALAWFEELYQEHEAMFQNNSDMRYIIGNSKVKRIINNPKKATKLKLKILKAMEYWKSPLIIYQDKE